MQLILTIRSIKKYENEIVTPKIRCQEKSFYTPFRKLRGKSQTENYSIVD